LRDLFDTLDMFRALDTPNTFATLDTFSDACQRLTVNIPLTSRRGLLRPKLVSFDLLLAARVSALY